MARTFPFFAAAAAAPHGRESGCRGTTAAGSNPAVGAGSAAGAGSDEATGGARLLRGHDRSVLRVGPIKLRAGNKLAPIWAVTNGVAGQRNIIDTVPGKADYSPLWQLNKVTFKDGITPHLLKSKADVDAAVKAGEVTVTQTNTVINCPVLGFGQRRLPVSQAAT